MRKTVVGYDYKAQRLCDTCIRPAAEKEAADAGAATMWGDCGSSEDIIGEWALTIGLDWDDEASYDSNEFPKRVFEDDAHDACTPANGYDHGQCGDVCEGCGSPLGFSCPNIDNT